MVGVCRILSDRIAVENFVQGVLGYTKVEDIREATGLILKAEMQLSCLDGKCTLNNKDCRDQMYRDDISRGYLKTKIFEELIGSKREENDDDIQLGRGGLKPRNGPIHKEKQAYFIIGLPASGKSTIASIIADANGAMILDSDYAKRKFVEFNADFGATLVHEESSEVIFGGSSVEYCVLDYCCLEGINIVIPKIGHDAKSTLKLAKSLNAEGYDIHMILVSLDRKKATLRAYNRFKETGRYVSLALIFDMYANEPMLTYYRLRENSVFKSCGAISTDVPKGSKYIILDNINNSPISIFAES